MRSLLVLSAALAMVLPPAEAAARQTTQYPTADELRARLDELRPEREAAREAAVARELRDMELLRTAAAAVATVDTIQVGMMTIITPVEQSETARELFTEVWDESFAHISESRELRRARFAFQWANNEVPIHIVEHARPIELNSRWIRRANVKQTIHQSIASTINYDLSAYGALVGRWVGGNALQAQSYDRIYRMIATAQSRSTRACLDGVVAECISGLRLTMPNRPRWTLESTADERLDVLTRFEAVRLDHMRSWYTPDERRAMVARDRGAYSRGGREMKERCVEGADFDACDSFLMQRGGERSPMSAAVRESFMAYAVEMGGQGAWERLLDDPSMSAIEALEHASNQPIEELAAGWRAEVLDHRPETFASLVPKGGLAVLWSIFFSAFALRSTRWRLG